MRLVEQRLARQLRRRGRSVGVIARQLRCSKSSISRWVRDIPLTPDQIEKLESDQERGRARAANHPNSPKAVWGRIRAEVFSKAAHEIPQMCPLTTLKILGAGLYWAEGYKLGNNMVNFSNSDPSMIKVMMVFFRKVCKVLPAKFRGVVHIHPHLDRHKAQKFWSKVSGIPLRQFHRTQISVSKASQQKRDTLPLGTFRIVISDTRLKSRINGWIRGIQSWSVGGE